MTAHAMKGDRERCLAAGMDGYIPKPIQPTELFRAIEGHLTPAGEAEQPATQGKVSGQVFDRAAVLARVDGDRELLANMVRLFLEEGPKLLSATRQAVAQSNAKALERAAHALKSMVGNFGADEAFRAAGDLERMGRESSLSEAQEAYQALEAEIERLKPALASLGKEVAR